MPFTSHSIHSSSREDDDLSIGEKDPETVMQA